ncbi:unnamed protein product [Rotaria sp. Silwood2]|nr:unnamed protein product [Rotaria sp. Silwood2]
MHTVFRIVHVQPIENRLWQVELTLTTADDDQDLKRLTERIRQETQGGTGWLQLGKLLMKMAHFKKAEEVYQTLLKDTSVDNQEEILSLYLGLGRFKSGQGEYEQALEFYQKTLENQQKLLSPNHSSLATTCNNIALVYDCMGEHLKAFEFCQKALEIQEHSLPSDHFSLAITYGNIGLVHLHMGEYLKALKFYQKALEIEQRTLPSNHPDLALTYSCIGGVYHNMGEFSKSLEFYQKVLEINQKSLPPNHPDLAATYNNIGGAHLDMGDYSKALEFYQKTLKIIQNTRPPNHLNFAVVYENIGTAHLNMEEYSDALESFQKSSEIRKKSLPPNHPDMGATYNNIALEFYRKTLEIRQKSLPPNHLSLAITYNNIGHVHTNMGEYSKALDFHEKALEIERKILPPNHPDLATTYNNIALVHDSIGQYSKAADFNKKTLDIQQKSLPSNHASLAVTYNNIGAMHSSNRGKRSTVTVLNEYINNNLVTNETTTDTSIGASESIVVSSTNNHVLPNDQPPAALPEASSTLDSMELKNDIGNYINNRLTLTDDLRYLLLTQHFIPDEKFKWPFIERKTNNTVEKRFLRPNHLNDNKPWLVYSPSKAGLYCVTCALFAKPGGINQLGQFVLLPCQQYGNFRALLRYRVDAGDSVLANHLCTTIKTATYISKTTQNELIEICGDLVREKIITEVKHATFFTVIGDETMDVSNIEQFTFCLRYVYEDKVQEKFISFVSAEDRTGEGLARLILQELKNLGLDPNFMGGQAYDGCSAMAGQFNGTQLTVMRTICRQMHQPNAPAQTPEDYYRINLFIPVLDHFIASLVDRFGAHQWLAYNVSALIPSMIEQKSFDDLKNSINFYEAYLPSRNIIKEEFQLYKRKWTKEAPDHRPNNAIDAYVSSTLPVTTATGERNFSTLKLLKIYLRSTMTENRLNGLAMKYIHATVNIDVEQIPADKVSYERDTKDATKSYAFTDDVGTISTKLRDEVDE